MISTILLVVLYSSILENAYAYIEMFMFMLVSIISFLWIKACCKMARYSTIQKLDRSFSSASFAASLKPPLLQDGGPIRSGICKLRYGSLLCTVSTWSGESASNLPSRLRKQGGLMRQITCSGGSSQCTCREHGAGVHGHVYGQGHVGCT